MKIALLHDVVPFERRPIDDIAERAVAALRECGHDARLVCIPQVDAPTTALLAASLVIRGAERTIGLSFPAYLMAAPGAEPIIWALGTGGAADATADLRAMLTATRLYCASTDIAEDIAASTGLRAVTLAAPEPEDVEGWRAVAEELGS